MSGSEAGGWRGRTARVRTAAAGAVHRVDKHPALLVGARLLRELLPGDSRYGDPLSTAGASPAQAVVRRLSDLTADRPGLLREMGLSALQVWQAAAEAQGRGRGDVDLAIAFTDLEEFSTYVLRAGDDAALELLRDVGDAVEPAVRGGGGQIVKRLGDGVMAVFPEPAEALRALCRAASAVEALEADGFRPRMRAGLHVGRPRRLAGDFFGVDVNVAARLAEQASGGEILVSDVVLPHVEREGLAVERRRRLKVKGVPQDVSAYRVRRP